MHGQHSLPARNLRRHTLGLSLVELMVAITIGLLLLLAMTALLSQQNQARDELGKSAAQNENGRYALMLLKNELQHAGYFGQFDGTGPLPAALPNPCAVTAAAIEAAMGLPVQAYDSLGAIPAPLSTCLDDANHLAGTDILVVRRLHTGAPSVNPAALALEQPNRLFAQTTPLERIVDVGANDTSFTLVQKDLATPAEIRPVVVHIYFISPCDVFAAGQAVCTAAADGGTPIPTLKRLELGVSGGGPAFLMTPLVQGIEDLQFDYGIDVDGNGSPSTPFVTAPALAQLPDVVAIKINLLARSTAPTRGYTDTKIYNMGVTGDLDAFNDEFKRHVYSTTVRLNNPSGRRE
jgi:type IV pilus assembly protein PilW